jgi:E3 SUMO-protein ligase PIAS1
VISLFFLFIFLTQILQETGDDVIDVLMNVDGSWKVAPAQADKSVRHTGGVIQQTGGSVETETSSLQVIDLINGNDDEISMEWESGLEDTKPLLNSQDLSVADYLHDLPTGGPAQTEDLYPGNGNNGDSNIALTSCQNLLLPSTGGFNSSSFGTLESIVPQNVLCSVITDAISPSLETSTSTSGMQHASTTVQLQPQIGPLHVSETRRLVPRNIRREPIGVQALPVPQQDPGSSRRLQPNTIDCPPPIPISSPASSTYQAQLIMNPDSVITPRNNGGRSLPRTPSATPLLHLQSSTLVTIFSSN